MVTSVSTLDGRSDAELISAVRAGDVAAYGELFSRHVEAARRLGRQLVPAPDVDDLVSEAFAKVLGVLQRGGGPDLAFRAYLLTAVRRLHVDRIRATSRLHSTDDLTPFDPGVPFRDTAVEGFENAAAARAFAALPERWQLVLWHTEVEGQKPAEVAPLLGMTPNAVSALAYRAREGLRQAYLSMHSIALTDDDCERCRAELGAYVRGGLSRRDAARVEQHLERCRPCTALYLELVEVNADLRALLAPLLLGAAAAAYVAAGTGGGAAAAGGLVVLLGRARDAALSHGPTAAVAGAAAAVVAGAVFTLNQGREPAPEAGDAPSVVSTAPDPAVPRSGGPAERVDATPGTPVSGTPVAGLPAGTAAADGTTPPVGAPGGATPTESGQHGQPGGTPQPSESAPPSQPSRPSLVRASASASVGVDGVRLGLGLGVAGVTVVPDTTVGVPFPPAG